MLELAARKAAGVGAAVEWRQGFGDELDDLLDPGSVDKVVSSLVLHQCPLGTKAGILAAMHGVLRPGGLMAIADYGRQRSLLMRLLFRQVQMLDRFENTQPNADGVLPKLMAEVRFQGVEEKQVVPTPTGLISLYTATRAPVRRRAKGGARD